MRTHQALKSIVNFAAATALLSGATATACKARHLSPPAAETGYQGPLINRPACLIGPSPDNWSACSARDPQHRIGSPLD
jgi:hypothetical protein